ncbi:hypothetical protein [Carnobacterium sp. FSL E2-0243]|uniref:hypothetical protein n=1 Tax=Carnobacterium sp. FSL E2-0243 TaxID=2921365 RepID=UPI0030F7337D
MREVRPEMIDTMIIMAEASNQKLILQTGGATIAGTPLSTPEDFENMKMVKLTLDSYDKLLDSLEIEDRNDDKRYPRQLVWLKDVTILNSTPVKMPFMCVFVSEISSVSFGSI